MADNLIFPIVFDLDKAVEQAGKDWNSKFADKLEKLIAKRPVNVKLNIDLKKLDNLDAVKKKLAQIKLEPINLGDQKELKDLVRELERLAKAMEKVQKFKGIELPELQAAKAAKLRKDEAQADEKLALAKERVRQANERLILSQQRAEQQSYRTGKAYGTMTGYVDRFIKRLAVYVSFSLAQRFLTSIRDVTAEFELQRVSLGAIIQDQNRANQLFSEIKSFALKSPVSIMDLTKYTKQVAAYRIETDKLFETTKRLADVSVGLGVDMGRLTLAYGQTKAASVLRAAEIRQYTEAGIPMLELLSEKFTELQGKMVSTEEVMKLVSKRAVGFEMVEQIFKDMTEAGGMFYNMQEKQGNTLFGMWAKLGDAASVMYDQIGNTESVNKGIKKAIDMLTQLMKNWKAVSATIGTMGAIAAVASLPVLAYKKGEAANAEKVAAATKKRVKAQIELNNALKSGTSADRKAAREALNKAKADEQAAISAQKSASMLQKVGKGFLSIGKSMLTGLGIGLVISLVTSLVYKFADAIINANKLQKALSAINAETGVEMSRVVTNFESLAKQAVEAADGSREQNKALDELKRTYRDIIPSQDLTIEKLREMKGEYSNLTIAIREYVREQQLQKGLNTILEETGSDIIKETRKFQKKLKETSFLQDGEKVWLGDEQIDRIIKNYERLVREGKDATTSLEESLRLEGLDTSKTIEALAIELGLIYRTIDQGSGVVYRGSDGLTKAIQTQEKELNDWRNQMNETYPLLGKFAEYMKEAKEEIDTHIFDAAKGTFAFDIENARVQIDSYISALNKAIKESGVEINLADFITITPEGIKRIDFSALNNTLTALDSEWKVQLQNMTKEVQNIYNGFIPQDRTVDSLQDALKKIASKTGVSMNELKRHLMKSKENWEDYSKRIQDSIKDYESEVEEMIKSNKALEDSGNKISIPYSDKEISDVQSYADALKMLLVYLKSMEKGKRGRKEEDPWILLMKNRMKFMEDFQKGVEDLNKFMGYKGALSQEQETMLGRGLSMNIDTKKLTGTREELIKWYEDSIKKIQKKIAKLGGKEWAGLGVQMILAKDTKNRVIKSYQDLLQEMFKAMTDFKTDKLQDDLEEKLKTLADRVARTKTAQEFYDKILGATGDINIAANVTISIYGDAGSGLFDAMVAQLKETLGQDIDLSMAIDMTNMRIDYGELQKIFDTYKEQIPEARREGLQKMISDGQKFAAEEVLNWEKVLAKTKDFEEQRTDVIKQESQRRADIIKSNLPEEEKQRLIKSSQKREKQELVKIDVEEFKASEDYIKVFQELDNVSTGTLDRIEKELVSLIEANKGLDAVNLKTYADALEKIRQAKIDRNPLKAVTQGIRDYIKAIKDRKIAKRELESSKKEDEDELSKLTNEKTQAKTEKSIADDAAVAAEEELLNIRRQIALESAKEVVDTTVLVELKKEEKNAENSLVTAQLKQNQAANRLSATEQKITKAVKNRANKEKAVTNAKDAQERAEKNITKGLNKASEYFGEQETLLTSVKDLLGDAAGEGTVLGGALTGGIEAMQKMQSLIQVITALQTVYNAVTAANPWLAIATAILAVAGIITGAISAAKVAKANKEIETQEELLDQLEYSYERLQKAAEDLFGSDYIQNFNQQINNLRSQAEAYQKQAEAEKSKGKKADEEKVKEYEESYTKTMDEIEDRRKELAEHFAGSDLTSAARDWAMAWIDAKTSFSNTTDAMKEKFADMMKNMIVESMAAAVMKQAMKPFYDELEKAMEDEKLSAEDIVNLTNIGLSSIDDANAALELFWNTLKEKGIDIKKIFGDGAEDLTGISRDIASASEESINGLAAGINTQNFYISHVPKIAENVLAIRMLMESGGMPSSGGMTMTDLVTMQNQHLSQLPVIAANTAEMVVRCERAAAASERSAAACENISLQLGRVIRPKGTPASHSVSTTIN